MATTSIEYFEDLTTIVTTCPPADAFAPDGKKEYFRVIKHHPANSDSFLPKKLLDDKKLDVDECIAKSLSLSDSLEGLLNAYFRTSAHKKKKRLIGVLLLTHNDGLLKQTFAEGHHSWWRSKSFDPNSVPIKTVET